jgi:hypothetical protein
MSEISGREKDRGWIAGLVLVGLASVSFALGMALPPTQRGPADARGAGPVEHHATVVTPDRSAR